MCNWWGRGMLLSHLVLLCCSEVIQTYTQKTKNNNEIKHQYKATKHAIKVVQMSSEVRCLLICHVQLSKLDLNVLKSKKKQKKNWTSFPGNGVRLWGAVQCFLRRKEVMSHDGIEISWCKSHIAALPLKLHIVLLRPLLALRVFTNNASNLHTSMLFRFTFELAAKFCIYIQSWPTFWYLEKSDHPPNQITCRCHATVRLVTVADCLY